MSDLVEKARKFAKDAHVGQKRLSGDDFFGHPEAVAGILESWGMDDTTVAAGFLHDTIKDGAARRDDLVKEFGEDVARLVDGVTKVTNIRLKGSGKDEFVENLRKMILVMAKDLRVVFVKLADRLHNMRTLEYLSEDKQLENSLETLEIYAPLAERLGMGLIKSELEDLAFPYVYPEEYKKVKVLSKPYLVKDENLKKMYKRIHKELKEKGIKAKIDYRKKRLFSLWRKLLRSEIDWDFEKIHDVLAIRIRVEKVESCYLVLGVVHYLYKPVAHIGVSDFIAQPKPNGYRSIHTKVFGSGGKIVEVQIRTNKMHMEAEMGSAAHWMYSEVKKKLKSGEKLEKGGIQVDSKLKWVKQLAKWQEEITSDEEFLETVKFDAFNHRNFVFSPNGDVYDLPRYATPVDFAYAVHTKLGNYIKGARVNGKLVSLSQKLVSGDVVEVIKSKTAKKPSRDWLGFVVSRNAKSQIKKFLKR